MPVSSPRHADTRSLVELGAAIQRIRKARGISQEELAHRSSIDRSYMSSIERGKQNPGVISIFSIAAALEITTAALMSEAEL